MDDNSDNMHLLYIQKQEQLLLEHIRGRVDYEIKLHILNDRVTKLTEQANHLQMTLQSQQDINRQAIESFERVSEENFRLKDISTRLEQKVAELESGSSELTTKVIEFNNQKSSYEKRIKDLQTEINRQSEELERLYNQSNPKKKKKPELLVEQPTDSGTF
jgi:chromosome segregation ATPase